MKRNVAIVLGILALALLILWACPEPAPAQDDDATIEFAEVVYTLSADTYDETWLEFNGSELTFFCGGVECSCDEFKQHVEKHAALKLYGWTDLEPVGSAR